MEKQELSFENFLFDVNPLYHELVKRLNDGLLGQGYKRKLEMAKSGYLVSYSHPKTKRSILNFVFRKGGLYIRLYADHVDGYREFLETMPDGLEKLVAKTPSCKRLLNPTDCNSRCPMGYDFELRGTRHRKCRYNCFLLPVNDESARFLEELVGREMEGRAAG